MAATGDVALLTTNASVRTAELYRRHLPAAVALAYLLTGSFPAAEDLAQEAFLRVAGRLLRDDAAFPAYLRRTIINLWKNDLRRRGQEDAYIARQGSRREEFAIVDLATTAAVRAALLRLNPRQRAAIVLRYYEDLPEREISALLRCRPGTVKSLLSRAIDSLRAHLGDAMELSDG